MKIMQDLQKCKIIFSLFKYNANEFRKRWKYIKVIITLKKQR